MAKSKTTEKKIITQEPVYYKAGTKVVLNGKLYQDSKSNKVVQSVNGEQAYIVKYADNRYKTTFNGLWIDSTAVQIYKGSVSYTVKADDTIYSIAIKYNIDWKQLYAMNKFVIGNNPDDIKEGQKLIIKK